MIVHFGINLYLVAAFLFTLFAALWLMFAGYATSNTWLQQYQLSGDLVRRILIASCLIIYFVRLQVTVWVFQKRKWTWLETITITVLMSFVVYAFAKAGGNNKQVVGVVEVIGILLYLSGSYINTHSEYSRHVWKLKEENTEDDFIQRDYLACRCISTISEISFFSPDLLW